MYLIPRLKTREYIVSMMQFNIIINKENNKNDVIQKIMQTNCVEFKETELCESMIAIRDMYIQS